jgi:predicted nuclease with TOPRIM domain
MGFWNYLGNALALNWLLNRRRKSHSAGGYIRQSDGNVSTEDLLRLNERYNAMSERYDDLSSRADELEAQMDDLEIGSASYEALEDEYDRISDEMDLIDESRDEIDDYLLNDDF